MSVIGSNILAGASGQGGDYTIARSLRFRSSASAYLNRTPSSSPTDAKKYTYSTWIKKSKVATANQFIYGCGSSGSDETYFGFNGSDKFEYLEYTSGAYQINVSTTAVYRDPSAWYHLVLVLDTTQATSSDRVKLYINGVQQTLSGTFPSLNYATSNVNSTDVQNINRLPTSGGLNFDGYYAETIMVDGQALTPSSFGANNASTGVWQPKKYAGTYGTNGFYLPFSDNASTTTLGNDFSGNGNNWTTNNISLTAGSTYDSMTDVPTLTSATAANYCVLNPVNKGSGITLSSANLNATSSATYGTVLGTIGASSGKYYWEVLINSSDGANTVGIGDGNTDVSTYIGKNNNLGYTSGGLIYGPNDTTTQSGLATYTVNDIIGVALNMDSSEVKFYKNNTLVTTVTGLSATSWFPAVADNSGSSNLNVIANFGQRPFAYTPPTGFVALNTFNLP